jgi:hypothetical protein
MDDGVSLPLPPPPLQPKRINRIDMITLNNKTNLDLPMMTSLKMRKIRFPKNKGVTIFKPAVYRRYLAMVLAH